MHTFPIYNSVINITKVRKQIWVPKMPTSLNTYNKNPARILETDLIFMGTYWECVTLLDLIAFYCVYTNHYWNWSNTVLGLWFSSVQSLSCVPHEPQHARPPCPLPTPGLHPNSCASSRWCHPTISSSAEEYSVQFSSVAQSCPTLCDPMKHSTPGLPVHHQLPEFTQVHVHRVGDAIQPSHPLSSPSPPAPNPSQHQSLFQWVNSSHEVVKVLEFHLQHQSF